VQSEHARAPRHPFVASAELIEMASEARLTAQTSDLSLTGCYFDTVNPFPVGTRVKLKLAHANASFEAFGTVVHSQPNMGMGVAFTRIEPDYLTVLERWIGALSGG
jgi:PilZ domain